MAKTKEKKVPESVQSRVEELVREQQRIQQRVADVVGTARDLLDVPDGWRYDLQQARFFDPSENGQVEED